MKFKLIIVLFINLLLSVPTFAQQPVATDSVFTHAENQTKVMLQEITKAQQSGITTLVAPRSFTPVGDLKLVSSKDWTSGFFPGVLWFLYDYTKNNQWLTQARAFTAKLEDAKFDSTTHDVGFKIYNSYGAGYQLTKNPAYREVIIQAAKTLSTRFNPKTGCIRSWDNTKKWAYPVIIDNMMNLELLFAATRLTGDSTYYNIAVSHASTTLKNHFRADYSSWHVVDYDTLTGEVIKKTTHQGYSNESAWARGQAWGLYGFTMCYRETKNKLYLQHAEKIASYILDNPNLPADLVPYWDFDAPLIPNEPRDASAASIIASGLYELSTFSKNRKLYIAKANTILSSLSNLYTSPVGENKGFILLHSTGHKPANSEVDMPLIYADYYYLEAYLRKSRLNTAPVLAPVGNKTITLGQKINFTAKVTDANAGQKIVFSLINEPEGAMINASTGMVNWKPTTTGTFTFTIRATDNGTPTLSDKEKITITVNPKPTYKLKINTTGNGSISPNPDQESYASGSQVTLTATPAPGYQFQGWSGDTVSTANPLTVSISGDMSLTASFVPVQGVVSFTLVNTDTNQPIRNLKPHDELNFATLPTKNISIQVNTNPERVGSVVLELSGTLTKTVTENIFPYALFGDEDGDLNTWNPAPGSYSLTATSYSGMGASGDAGSPLTINFKVIYEPANIAQRKATTELIPGNAPLQVSAYPTPTTNGQIKVSFSKELTGEITYTLLSLTGAKLTGGQLTFAHPATDVPFNFSQQMQTPGIYYLRLQGTNLNTTLKLLRQ